MEVNAQERPTLSLISNASSRWTKEKQALDAAKKKAESELTKLKDVPQTKKSAEESLRKAGELLAEAAQSYATFGTAEAKAKERFNTARRSTGSTQRTVRSYIKDIANAMLGNLTIFAKAKGETGDLRLAVDLDGKIGIDSDVPEGQESACHQMLTDLQAKVGDVVDFNITDWGRAKDYKPQTAGGTKVKVQQQHQVRQRY